MHILVIASGSRGDVQPYIALAKGLVQAGHSVRFVTHENFRSLAELFGLELWTTDSNVQEIAQSPEFQEQIGKGNFITLMARMAKAAEREAVSFARTSLAASEGVDLILTGWGGMFIGLAIAEKQNLPFLQAYLVPFTPTRAFSSAIMPDLPKALGPLVNPLSHHALRQIMWQGSRPADNAARRQVLSLPLAKLSGPYHSKQMEGMPILYGYSPSVIPAPPDWDRNITVTGYWFLDEGKQWTPPEELEEFLRAGPPPVTIGFGSMGSRNPQEVAGLVISAVQQSGQRAVLLTGWGGLMPLDLPDSVFVIESAPHDWLYPRSCAVVHHGGAGTTSAGLRAGVPSIVVPFFGDQPFWGRKVAELGVGPDPIPQKKLTADNLTAAILTAVKDEGMLRRAAALSARIRTEDGVARAVEVIDQVKLP